MKLSTQNRIVRLLFGVLLVHLTVCLVLVFFPRAKDILGVSKTVRYYFSYAVIGPFFREETVTASFEFHVRHKTESGWSDWVDIGQEQFSSYSQQRWKFSELKKTKYLAYCFRNLYTKVIRNPDKPVEKFREMKVIDNYLRKTFLPEQTDSAHVIYILKRYKGTETRLDTLINLPYQVIEH